jgi:hypothetical protein
MPHDSGMWRYHDRVELEAPYLDGASHGSGLVEILRNRA